MFQVLHFEYIGMFTGLYVFVQLVPSHLLMIAISLPDGNVTRSGRIGFVLGVWLPS